MVFLMPVIQLIILVNAATMEMKRINMYVIDKDLSSTSRQLINKFKGSPFFVIKNTSFSMDQGEEELKNDKTDVVLQIPSKFERDLVKDNSAKVQVIINAINGTAGELTYNYVLNIINDYNNSVIVKWGGVPAKGVLPASSVDITNSYWYNPQLDYKTFMVPGVLVLLVTLIALLLSSLNLVREKELGTIEQINVTPIHKYQFIAGKLLPFWIIALIELAFGMTVGKLLFNIPIVGSIGLVFFVASIYLVVVLGIGLFISTLADTQQQAMFVAFFFMIVFLMMSGLFTPIESMPEWAQKVNIINPIAYFIRVIRMILLKGSGISDIIKEIGALVLYGIIMLSLAVWRYRKVA